MCNLDYTNLQYLIQLVHDNPDYFLNELLHLLKHYRVLTLLTIPGLCPAYFCALSLRIIDNLVIELRNHLTILLGGGKLIAFWNLAYL
jgi:hypothetical protein